MHCYCLLTSETSQRRCVQEKLKLNLAGVCFWSDHQFIIKRLDSLDVFLQILAGTPGAEDGCECHRTLRVVLHPHAEAFSVDVIHVLVHAQDVCLRVVAVLLAVQMSPEADHLKTDYGDGGEVDFEGHVVFSRWETS